MSNESLLAVLREHAYLEIALEQFLTIMPTVHGAQVPSHWVKDVDTRIASVLPDEVLQAELARRHGQ